MEAEGTRPGLWAWAVANAKELEITSVEVDGRAWNRQSRDGWQPAQVPAGQVR